MASDRHEAQERFSAEAAELSQVHPGESVTMFIQPQHIAQRAYELYCQRGKAHGHDLDDWLQAEREITERADRLLSDTLGLEPEHRRHPRP